MDTQDTGKDVVAEYISENFNLKYETTSLFVAEHIIIPMSPYKYSSVIECFNDRVNNREAWFNTIKLYNKKNKSRLIQNFLEENDIYCGVRDLEEFEDAKSKGLFDLSIWVDRSEHVPLEDSSSFNINKSQVDIIIDNNGSLDETYKKIDNLFLCIMDN